ncbi:uncharacterized protein LOC122011120 [Zingiber officinale]|uniref:uncharacterized protein LOC122011120 n=1 Tax=Zingiber officinale TaxID=94328 RepID=UPI001C4D3D2A|nr:uncharacterized protein LOC122011120 [Zingiber officinale]
MAGRIPFAKVIHLLLLAFLIVPPFLLLTRLRTQMDPLSLLNLQLSTLANIKFKVLEENTRSVDEQDDEMMVKPIALSSEREEKAGGTQQQSSNDTELIVDSVAENAISKAVISCDFSQRRTDTCVLQGDVRIQPSSSSVVLVESPGDGLGKRRSWN